MKFQICTCKKHLFVHGHFFDENGPLFRREGLVHLSGDIFCQTDALAFIQETVDSGKITPEEARVLGRDETLLSLPNEVPSGLALYQKNEKLGQRRIVTEVGKRRLSVYLESPHSLIRFAEWLLPGSLFSIFFAQQSSALRRKNHTAYRRVTEQMQKKRDEAIKEKLKQSDTDGGQK